MNDTPDMDMPLPEPASDVMGVRWSSGDSTSLHKQGTALIHGVNTYTAEQIRARDAQWHTYAAAQVAKERERLRAMLMSKHEAAKGQHNLYHCLAVELFGEAAIRAGS